MRKMKILCLCDDTQNTVLGEVLVARKTYVNVKDKNSSTAALENGDLSSDRKS